MMEWTTACVDWESRIVERQSLITCPPLFAQEAQAAWDICSEFQLVDVTGQPLLGEASLPWLKEFVMAVFGACDPESGRRHINEFFLMVSKKNAKSTIAAAIMLGALLMNWRQSAELLILSPTKEVADNSYKPIRDFINANPELSALLKVQDYYRLITHKETGATLKVVAADADTVSGKKASFVFVDELHEFGKKAKASNMLLEATGGLTSRPEGFVIYATTQSAEPPAGVFKTKLEYARKVRDGLIVDRRFLPVIYEFPQHMIESKAHEDLRNAYVTNPNWGASVDAERITQLHSQAKEGDEGDFKEFMAKHLNVEIGMNLRSDRWAGADHWEARGDASLTLEELLDRSEVVVAGVDGGGLDDLLGAGVIGRERETGYWLHWGKTWAHPSVLERRKEITPRLLDFSNDGDLVLVERIGDDVRELAKILAMIYRRGLFPKKDAIGLDQIGISFEEEFDSAGIPPEMLVGITQGYKMGGVIKTVERKLAEGTFLHGGRPMMAWSVSNAKVEQRANSILITKQASGTAKIDAVMALLDAATLMALNPTAGAKKIKQGFVVID